MTRAARRATTLLLAALTATLLSVALFAGPASAADDGVGGQAAEQAASESEPVHAVAREAEGFGTGMWDGMMLAAVTGVLLGIVVFGLSRPGEIDRPGHHGTDPHTPATPEALAQSVASASGTERYDHADDGRGDQ